MEDEFTQDAKQSVKKLPDEVFQYLDQQESWDWHNRIIEKFQVFKDEDGDINRIVTTEKRRKYTLEWQYAEGRQDAYQTETYSTLEESQNEFEKSKVYKWQNNRDEHRVELSETIWSNVEYDTDDGGFKMGYPDDKEVLDVKLFGTQEDEVQDAKAEIIDRLFYEFGIQDKKYQKLVVLNSDDGEEVGSMQVRISEHSQAAHNIELYGGESDYFISIVFAEVDPTSENHNRGELRHDVSNIDIDGSDNPKTAFEKIDNAIADALAYIQTEKEIKSDLLLQKQYENQKGETKIFGGKIYNKKYYTI